MNRMKTKLAVAAIAGLLAMYSEAASALEKVVVAQGNPRGFSAGLSSWFMAKKLGYFKDEGLEIDLINLNGSASVYPQVAQKRADIGWGAPIWWGQAGRDPVPVKFFYNHIYSNIWQMVVPASSSIQSFKDLKGKKIGVGGLSWQNVPVTRALLEDEAHLSSDKDYSFLAVGAGPTAFRAFSSGEVDALNLFATMNIRLQQSGQKIRYLKYPQEYLDLFSNAFFTHDDTIKNWPKMLEGFGRALAKGTVACQANLVACVKAYYEFNPTANSGTGAEKRLKENLAVVKDMQTHLYHPPGDELRYGEFKLQTWKNYIKILQQGGVIGKTVVPADALFTTRFVKAFNDFDADAVKARAKSLK